MQCDSGEIEVFLCPEEDTLGLPQPGPSVAASASPSSEDAATDTESECSPTKSDLGGRVAPPPRPPPRLDLDEESRSSDIGQIRNVLISASEDFGPVGKQPL